MSYQVIARKYRPQRFADVVGQEHVTRTLSNAINRNRIAHAYLFVGPRGTGKTTLARIFAKCLNCVDGPKSDFPEDDPKSLEIAAGTSMDVLEIDGASNRGIEEIRELRDTVKYAPSSSRFKIYIIDEVHMLTKEAFNALLKTLEEPPEHVKFMFATTEPEKVLPTILSRCQRFDLRRIPISLISEHLRLIAKQEGVDIDEAALEAIARGADGGMRDAESTLDQLISFCGDKIVESDVLSMFGLASQRQILELAEAILSGKKAVILKTIDELCQGGKELGRLLSELLACLRNLMVGKTSQGNWELIQAGANQVEVYQRMAERVETNVLERVVDVVSKGESGMRGAVSKRIHLEVSLLRAAEAAHSVSIEKVLRHLKKLQENGDDGQASADVPTERLDQASPPKPHESTETPVEAQQAIQKETENRSRAVSTPEREGAKTKAEVDELWASVLKAVAKKSKFALSYLRQGFLVQPFDADHRIGFPPGCEETMNLVDNEKNKQMLLEIFGALGVEMPRLRFVITPPPEGWMAPEWEDEEPTPTASTSPMNGGTGGGSKEASTPKQPERLDPGEFKDDPLIKEALRIFKGQIVDVRK